MQKCFINLWGHAIETARRHAIQKRIKVFNWNGLSTRYSFKLAQACSWTGDSAMLKNRLRNSLETARAIQSIAGMRLKRRVATPFKASQACNWNGASTRYSKNALRNSIETARWRAVQTKTKEFNWNGGSTRSSKETFRNSFARNDTSTCYSKPRKGIQQKRRFQALFP